MSLNLPNKIKIGYEPRQSYIIHASVLPVGKTKSELKKLSDLNSFTVQKEFDNIPLPGFVIDEVDDYKNSTKWEIIDPRGFRYNISDINLLALMSTTSINRGLINDKCVWVRNDFDTKMTLMSITHPSFDKIYKDRNLLDNLYNVKDIKIGNNVSTIDGISGVYMGKFYVHRSRIVNNNSFTCTYLMKEPVSRYLIKYSDYIYNFVNLRVHTINNDDTFSKLESLEVVNNIKKHTNIAVSPAIMVFSDAIVSCYKTSVSFSLSEITDYKNQSRPFIVEDNIGQMHFCINSIYLSTYKIIDLNLTSGKITYNWANSALNMSNIKRIYAIHKHVGDEIWI